MSIALNTTVVDELGDVVYALREWQYDGAPVQLHPGDVGWNWRFGAEATAAALRTWSRDGEILAVGFRDSPTLLRLAVAPNACDSRELVHQMVIDVTEPERDVLPQGDVSVEARFSGPFREILMAQGWVTDESWTPLRRDLNAPVEESGLRIEVVGPELASERVALQRASFERSTFSEDKWHAMARGLPYADAQCLIAYDDWNTAVAVATVWSAGSGRPGLLEPLGVHHEHRGHGYGTAISLAAAAALRRLGSSSAIVCTGSSNVGAVATYRSAGFEQLPDVSDLRRGPTA
ncbi:MAG: GNAT family N-acetyltransferase [Acidimicrobiales bacterium]